jgi:hypothetical protein
MAIPLRKSLAAGIVVQALNGAPTLHAYRCFAILGQALRLLHFGTDAISLQQF